MLQAYTILTEDSYQFCLDVTELEGRKNPDRRVMFNPVRLEFHDVPVRRLKLAIPHAVTPAKLAADLDKRILDFERWDRAFNRRRTFRVLRDLTRTAEVQPRERVTKKLKAAAKEAAAVTVASLAKAAVVEAKAKTARAEALVVAFVVTPKGVKQAVRVEDVHGAEGVKTCTVRRKWNDPSNMTAVTVTESAVFARFDEALVAWRAARAE